MGPVGEYLKTLILERVRRARGRFSMPSIAWTIVSGLVVIGFMIYLAVDTQRMMGGSSCPIAPNEYVYASVQLFVDILFIFLNVLGMSR
ncbi:unnamed protein product [Toxocara canis]|uniref:Ion_trans domain-containing protein n=1 Tax=Toxocara canis TaxID=6265 RepID=A0A183U175_TOXCA|nr:unnamed protein product [Toxocara canis]